MIHFFEEILTIVTRGKVTYDTKKVTYDTKVEVACGPQVLRDLSGLQESHLGNSTGGFGRTLVTDESIHFMECRVCGQEFDRSGFWVFWGLLGSGLS